MDHYPVQLSGGEQQRVALARAFSCARRSSSPTSRRATSTPSTDPTFSNCSSTSITAKGTTLVLVTHDPALARSRNPPHHPRDGLILADEYSVSSLPTQRSPQPTRQVSDHASHSPYLRRPHRRARDACLACRFFFVLLSVAMGVAALTGVRGFSSAFRFRRAAPGALHHGSGPSARTFQPAHSLEQQALDGLAADGIRTTTTTEMLAMASAPTSPDPVLVSLKAVDPAFYPFYGTVDLAPALPLSRALDADSVAVGEDLLLRLNLHVGDSVKLGRQSFRIGSTVRMSPTASPAASPQARVYSSPASRSSPPGSRSQAVAPLNVSSSSSRSPRPEILPLTRPSPTSSSAFRRCSPRPRSRTTARRTRPSPKASTTRLASSR